MLLFISIKSTLNIYWFIGIWIHWQRIQTNSYSVTFDIHTIRSGIWWTNSKVKNNYSLLLITYVSFNLSLHILLSPALSPPLSKVSFFIDNFSLFPPIFWSRQKYKRASAGFIFHHNGSKFRRRNIFPPKNEDQPVELGRRRIRSLSGGRRSRLRKWGKKNSQTRMEVFEYLSMNWGGFC